MKQLILLFLFAASAAVGCAAALPLPADSAAAHRGSVVDEVVWVVGDEAILKSDIEQMRLQAAQEGVRFKGNPDCAIPEQIAVQKLFLHQAAIDSIEVSESDIASGIDQQIESWIQMAGSREKLEEYKRQTVSQMRVQLHDDYRDRVMVQKMQQKLVEDIKVTPAEVRHFFKDIPEDSLPLIPTQVEVELLAEHPRIQPEEIERVKSLLREYAERIQSGSSSFSTLAILYSEDPGSARQGGEMDYMGKMELDPAFANAAWSLNDPKKVSKIVESQFGYHIIQLVDKRGDKLKLRHILKKPRVEQADIDAALARLDSIAKDIRNGVFTFEEAASRLSDDVDSRANKGLMFNVTQDETTGERIRTSRFKMGELPTEVARMVESMQVGDVSNSFTMIDKKGKEQCCIVKLKNRIPAHAATITEDFQVLSQIVRRHLSEEFLNKWIRDKQRTTYIRINPDWVNCEFQYPGWVKE